MNNRNKSPELEIRPAWSSVARAITSILLVFYLFLVVLGPLSVPVGSEDLTAPLARKLAPFHQALFLGHGYRFFGPDPGPTHIIEYQILNPEFSSNKSTITGSFPDHETCWPRLRYHRWFMLSETIFNEVANLPDKNELTRLLSQWSSEIEACRINGELANMKLLVSQKTKMEDDYHSRNARTEKLLLSLAKYLIQLHGGNEIELFLRERLIARPSDIRSRIRLVDSRFLSEPKSLGKFRFTGTELDGSVELESVH